jgi:hypothetical protein
MPNNLEAVWTSDDAATGRVEVDLGEGGVRSYAAESATPTSHRALLLGLPAETEVAWTAITTTDGEEERCDGTALTGSLPDWLPEWTHNQRREQTGGPWLSGAAFPWGDGTPLVFVLDAAGDYAWYQALPEGTEVVGLQADPTRPGVLASAVFNADHVTDDTEVLRWALDGSEAWPADALSAGHHAVVLHDDGAVAWLARDVRDWFDQDTDATVPVAGDALVVRAADGTTRTLLSTWDILDVVPGNRWNAGFYPDAYDWTHANALTWSADRGTYLMSLGGIDTILEVDGESGAVLRSFVGEAGGSGVNGEGLGEPDSDDTFSLPHSPSLLEPDDLLLVSLGVEIEVVRYTIEAAGLQRTWSLSGDTISLALGSAELQPSAELVFAGGSARFLRQYDGAGLLLSDADFESGYVLGDMHVLPADLQAAFGE